jgi:exosortase A-associated hydrolase 1
MSGESAILFECAGEELCGILHSPSDPIETGVLLVVGGPQYRVGSHRQFVLLARSLCVAGIPVMRFDYRGMGDSCGPVRGFEQIGDDIASTLDVFFERQPRLRSVVLWGLCDAATANAFHATTTLDGRIIGQVALNPWVRTVAGEAEAFVKHYYQARLLSPDFWRKLMGMRLNIWSASRDFLVKLRKSRGRGETDPYIGPNSLPERLFRAQTAFTGKTLLILSGQDLTAKEYEARVAERAAWRTWLNSEKVEVRRLEPADHTFSRAIWREQVSDWTRDWILHLDC